MLIPRIVLAGAQSGVGKTTLTLGLLTALKDLGLQVQPFKVGPDYIDTGLHQVACQVPSHNLDSWMGTEKVVKDIFTKYSAGKDIAVIEGVMGLFDGAKGEKELGSTAHIAKVLQAPVILVVNARGMARSAAALVKGYMEFDKDLNLAGVIFNNVGSDNHARFLKEIVQEELNIPCLGFIKRKGEVSMPERHLGLVPAPENKELKKQIKPLAELVREGIDLKELLELAKSAPHWDYKYENIYNPEQKKVRLGVARDEAFNFYYQDSLNFLEDLGAELVYFSPLRDQRLPDNIHGLYLGGGFPELFLDTIEANQGMRESIIKADEEGLPIYAECGGFMYLLEELENFEGETYQGIGLIPAKGRMINKLAALGYVKGIAQHSSILTSTDTIVKGHEFHWSEINGLPEDNIAYKLLGGRGEDYRREGYVRDNLFASYLHLHFRSNPEVAKNLLKACAKRV